MIERASRKDALRVSLLAQGKRQDSDVVVVSLRDKELSLVLSHAPKLGRRIVGRNDELGVPTHVIGMKVDASFLSSFEERSKALGQKKNRNKTGYHALSSTATATRMREEVTIKREHTSFRNISSQLRVLLNGRGIVASEPLHIELKRSLSLSLLLALASYTFCAL
jgi:hypothetical protein